MAKLQGIKEAVNFVTEAYNHFKTVGASAQAAGLLSGSGIHLADPAATSGYLTSPDEDTGLVIRKETEDAGVFARQLVDAIAMHRHWGREMQMIPPAKRTD